MTLHAIKVFNGQFGLSYTHISASIKSNFQLNQIVFDDSYFTFIHEKDMNELVTVWISHLQEGG